MHGDLELWQKALADLQKISPPPKWRQMHKDFLQSLFVLNDAGYHFEQWVAFGDDGDLANANEELQDATVMAERWSRERVANLK